jgi:hypothetical protein
MLTVGPPSLSAQRKGLGSRRETESESIGNNKVFSNASELAVSLQSTGPSLILIDGWMAAGKTQLASQVASLLGIKYIDLDSYVEPQQKQFVASLRLDEVAHAIAAIKPLIVSGVCIRNVHELIGKPSCIHIYVKRMTSWGWADEDEALGNSPAFDAAYPPNALTIEVRKYHEIYKPHQRAGFFFHRLAN